MLGSAASFARVLRSGEIRARTARPCCAAAEPASTSNKSWADSALTVSVRAQSRVCQRRIVNAERIRTVNAASATTRNYATDAPLRSERANPVD